MSIEDSVRLAVDDFIYIVESPHIAFHQRRDLLMKSLDTLAYVYWLISFEYELPDENPVELDFLPVQNLVTSHFPKFGFYTDQCNSKDPVVSIGYAIDDVTSILLDLYSVRWLFSNAQDEAALATFHSEFASHWGQHLRSLQGYLHAQIDLET